MTNKELLICIDKKLGRLEEQFNNHLSHHFRVALVLLSITGSAVITLLVLLLK